MCRWAEYTLFCCCIVIMVRENSNAEGASVGGFASKPGKWPWQVFIEITRETNEKYKSQCGGTFLLEQWILSAGHCFLDAYKNVWKPTRITLGTTYRSGTGQGAVNFQTAEVYIHDDFDPVALSNDISLVKLPRSVNESKYIQKAVLPPRGTVVQKGKSCIATGWGATKPDGSIASIANVLQEVDVKIFGDDECLKLKALGEFSLASKSQVCAGHVEGGKDTCSGDSGGPLMCREGKSYVIRGITSHGPLKCGAPNDPGVYTRVTTFLKWIYKTIQGYHWKLNKKSECSVTCGKGVERQTRTCRDQHEKHVSNSNCDGASTLVTECINPECETYKWSSWESTCSVTCGAGRLTRTRECLSEKHNRKVENFNCGFGQTSKTSICSRPSCPEYHWKLGIKSECSVTCGKGVQRQTRTCRDEHEKRVSNFNCDGASTLVTECIKPECETYKWSSWESTCSVTCGAGKLTRTRECLSEKHNRKVENFNCGFGRTFKTSKCSRPSCPEYYWKLDIKSKCSVTCGKGIVTQTRTCRNQNNNLVSKTKCDGDSVLVYECIKPECGKYHWDIINTVCTVTCGEGIETKTRLCSDEYGKRVPADNCEGLSVLNGECFKGECETFKWSTWTTRCSATCGKGTQFKTRECIDEKGIAQSISRCKEGKRLEVVGSCVKGSCEPQQDSQFRWGQWSSWSSCRVALTSRVCDGFRSSTRDCLHEGKEVDPKKCTTSPTDDYYREEACEPRNCGSG